MQYNHRWSHIAFLKHLHIRRMKRAQSPTTPDMKVTDDPRGLICEIVLNSRARTDGHLNKEVKVDEGIGV